MLLFAFALLGLGASVYLTKIHYTVDREGLNEKSFCHVSEFVDCDSAVASRYSHLHTPIMMIPTAELGIIYYVLVVILLAYAVASENQKPTLSFLFGAAFFSVLYSAYQFYISVGYLGILCVFCFSTYVANLGLLLLLPSALAIRYAEAPKFLFHYFLSALGLRRDETTQPRLVFHLAVTVGLLVVGLVFFKGLNPDVHRVYAEVPRDAYLKAYAGLPKHEIDVSGRPFWGNPDAKIIIAEFSDFQCPFCRRAAFTLKPYIKEFRNDVKFVYMNFPLDSSCNPAIQVSMHPVSCLAAKAGICALKQGKFWEFHDEVFENQKRLSRSTLLDLATKVGLDVAAFEPCVISDEAAAGIKKDVEQGSALQIEGTPSIYINGRLFRDWQDPNRLRMIIEAEKNGEVSTMPSFVPAETRPSK